MPIFEMVTNVSNVPESFLSNVSKEISRLTDKEESRVCVHVKDGTKLLFAGTSEYLKISKT